MAANPFQQPDRHVIERKCRLVIDVQIRISEITSENVVGYFTSDETDEGLTWEWAERQNRLLLALLHDEELLDQFLAHLAEGDFGFLLESKLIKSLSDEEENELFEKI